MIGRPQQSEAAPYYFPYINHVGDGDIVAILASQSDDTRPMFDEISEETSLHRYAADKWSIRQVLNHITDTERALSFRALWFARGFESPLPSYDQELAAAHAEADQIAWLTHVEEFRRVRLVTVSLFANLPKAGWLRTGTASGNVFTVRALAYIIAGHLTHHAAIVREKYLHVG